MGEQSLVEKAVEFADRTAICILLAKANRLLRNVFGNDEQALRPKRSMSEPELISMAEAALKDLVDNHAELLPDDIDGDLLELMAHLGILGDSPPEEVEEEELLPSLEDGEEGVPTSPTDLSQQEEAAQEAQGQTDEVMKHKPVVDVPEEPPVYADTVEDVTQSAASLEHSFADCVQAIRDAVDKGNLALDVVVNISLAIDEKGLSFNVSGVPPEDAAPVDKAALKREIDTVKTEMKAEIDRRVQEIRKECPTTDKKRQFIADHEIPFEGDLAIKNPAGVAALIRGWVSRDVRAQFDA